MRIIITGSTGMIGEGVLLECIENPAIEEILSVSRKPAGIKHPKLKEYIVPDFLALKESDERLKGYDACFFCAGVSSVGMKEDVYKQITYDTTIHFAECLNPNPGMTFIYVSGGGTDSSEKGRLTWARIKGKTENDLMKMPFKNVFGYYAAAAAVAIILTWGGFYSGLVDVLPQVAKETAQKNRFDTPSIVSSFTEKIVNKTSNFVNDFQISSGKEELK